MTEEQKEILIAKMLDAPSSLSDEELDSILLDDELRDIYEASVALSSACIRQPELDMKAEWNSFRPNIRRKPTAMRWVMRVAAIFLGVFLASSLAVRFDYIFTNNQPATIAVVEQSPELNYAPVVPQNPQTTEMKKDDAGKNTTIDRKHSLVDSHHHSTKVEISQSPPAAQVEPDIDIDEYLRIQQARIDNNLAIQVAESYIVEYDDIVAILDAVGAYDSELDNAIKRVTME